MLEFRCWEHNLSARNFGSGSYAYLFPQNTNLQGIRIASRVYANNIPVSTISFDASTTIVISILAERL